MTHKQMIAGLAQSIIDTVGEFPDGAPVSSITLALASKGLDHAKAIEFVDVLVELGFIRRANNQLFPA